MEATATASTTASTTGSSTIADLIPRAAAAHGDNTAIRYKRDGAWHDVSYTQLADTVRIVVETAGFSGTFRIHARGLDSSQDIMTLAGEATPDGWLP